MDDETSRAPILKAPVCVISSRFGGMLVGSIVIGLGLRAPARRLGGHTSPAFVLRRYGARHRRRGHGGFWLRVRTYLRVRCRRMSDTAPIGGTAPDAAAGEAPQPPASIGRAIGNQRRAVYLALGLVGRGRLDLHPAR